MASWKNPRWGSLVGPDASTLQAIFESLSLALDNPTITVGDPTYNPTTNVVTDAPTVDLRSLPRGEVGYGELNLSPYRISGIVGTEVGIIGTPSITLKVGRKYKISARWRGVHSDHAGDIVGMNLRIAGFLAADQDIVCPDAIFTEGGGVIMTRFAPSGSDVTGIVSLTAYRAAGTGNCSVEGTANSFISVLVEDIGGV